MADILTLFTDISIVSAVFLLVGLVFVSIECFIPGFGFFGISGSIFIVFAIVFRMVIGGTWWHLFYMCTITILVLTVVILIAVRSARFGAISKTPLIQNETALPTNFASNEANYEFLLDKQGVALTVCKPAGKIEIEGKEYQAITSGDYIEKSAAVKVVDVDGTTIVIKKV